jgi:hypothetical protein
MPVSYLIDETVVIIRSLGVHSTDELRDAWLAAEADPLFPVPVAVVCICIDARLSTSLAKRSLSDLRATAAWFEQRVRLTSRRCAWVTRPGIQFGLARMMAAWIESQGYRTFVTTQLDDALVWLKAR